MNRDQFTQQLLHFVQEELAGSKELSTSTLLFSEGIIDSLKILDLIAYVETVLAITVADKDVTLENFSSIDAIVKAFSPKKYA